MDELGKAKQRREVKEEFSYKDFFIPLTTFKAIHWIVVIGLVVYANMLFNGFVWDDGFQLESNSFVQSGQFFYYFTHTIGPYYKPLMFFFYTLIFQLFQLNSFFYHFFQLTLHIINAIFVFLLLKYFLKNSSVSFIVAVVFLIHPINDETVAYIADYQDVLFIFFGLGALLVTAKEIFRKYSDFMAALLLFLSSLSKETGILFIVMNILFAIFFKKTGRLQTIVYSLSTALCYFFLRYILVGMINPMHFVNAIPPNTITSAPLIARLYTIPKILFFYLTTFIYPDNLAIQYWYVISVNFSDFVLPFLINLTFFAFLIVYGMNLTKKKTALSKFFWFFYLWFCIGLLLHLQFFPLDFTAADRWFYFPEIGLLGMMAVITTQVSITHSIAKKYILFFIILAITLLSIRTVVRNTDWYSTVSLFHHDISTMENVADPQYLYGTALSEQGDYSGAVTHLSKASLLDPSGYQIWQNLGIVYLHLHQFDKAKDCFTKEIALNNDSVLPYRSLIYILLIRNQSKEAASQAKMSVKNWPNDPYLWRMLGLAAYQLHNKSFAQSAFEKSYALAPLAVTQYYITQMEQNLPIEMREL